MKEQLKPCPFCGNSELELHTDAGIVYITCQCGICTTDFGGHDDLETDIRVAIETWNTRPYQKEIERLNKEASWLAEQIMCCSDDKRIDSCTYDCSMCNELTTVNDWREAAHKAVEAEQEGIRP